MDLHNPPNGSGMIGIAKLRAIKSRLRAMSDPSRHYCELEFKVYSWCKMQKNCLCNAGFLQEIDELVDLFRRLNSGRICYKCVYFLLVLKMGALHTVYTVKVI